MKKTFVLDTNVLLHDPGAIFSFDDNNIVIPIYVVEEIDHFKKELSELGRNARMVSRHLDNLRNGGCLSVGVNLDSGGNLRVAISNRVLPREITTDRGQDARILAVAFDEHEKNKNAVFITKDTNLRIRADAIGLETENYEPDHAKIDVLAQGYHVIEIAVKIRCERKRKRLGQIIAFASEFSTKREKFSSTPGTLI